MQGELDKAHQNISYEAWDRWLTRAAINLQSEIVSTMQMDQPPATESLRILRRLLAALISCESEDIPEAGGPTRVQYYRMLTGIESMIAVLPQPLADLWSAELQAALKGDEDALQIIQKEHDRTAAKLKLKSSGEKPRKEISNFRRILGASLLAPLSMPALGVLILCVTWPIPVMQTFREAILGAILISTVVGYAFMFVVYLPLYLFMRYMGWTGRWYQSLSGFLCVTIPLSPMLIISPDLGQLAGIFGMLFGLGVMGFLTGGTFWWASVRQNGQA